LTLEPAATLRDVVAGLSWLQRMSLLVTSPTKPLLCQFFALRTAVQGESPLTMGRVSTDYQQKFRLVLLAQLKSYSGHWLPRRRQQ
jgi:hypothetical protein